MSILEFTTDKELDLYHKKADIDYVASELASYAPLDSPSLTGSPAAPTPSPGDNDTSIATTAFVQTELADYAPLASPALTGNPTAPTPAANDNDTSIATTAFVQTEVAISRSFKNRIINGAMRIDQRNAGAAVTTSSAYPVDRFNVQLSSSAGTFSAQQETSVLPTGWSNLKALKILATAADASVAANEYLFIEHTIEGYNVADLALGTAAAKAIAVSFWVRSSLTGTYCVSFLNATNNRSFVSEYTINSADTWEYKTITLTGDTTGTWNVTNGTGIKLRFALVSGSTYHQVAGSWGTTNAITSSNQVNWLGTINNTFYITGIQLEEGSLATNFEHRNFGQEISLCERYYQLISATDTYSTGNSYSTTEAVAEFNMRTIMRVAPTITLPTAGQTAGTISFLASSRAYPSTTGSNSAEQITEQSFQVRGTGYTGLTNTSVSALYSNGATAIKLSAEL